MSIHQAKLRSSFYTDSEVKPQLKLSTLFRTMEALLFMTVGHPYLSCHGCGHALCGSHLLRELAFIKDAHNYAWAHNMKRLLQETCKKVSVRTEKRLSDKELANLQKRYRNILTRGEKELRIIPPKPSGKRGKPAKSDTHNLWERLKKI